MHRKAVVWAAVWVLPAFLTASALRLSAEDGKPGGEESSQGAGGERVAKPPPKVGGVDDTGDALLAALNSYQIAIKKCVVKESGRAGGLTVGVTVVPEAYRFQLVEAFQKLLRDGYRGEELWKRFREREAALKSLQGKTLLRVSLQGTGNYFLQGDPKSLFRLKRGAVRLLQVTEVNPAPVFEPWKVIESASAVKRLNLARFQSAEFDALFTWNGRQRDPIPLALAGIASQAASADRNNSINLQAKQISCRSWDDLILPQVRFTLKPAEWKVPELPPEVAAFLASSGK